MPGLTDTLLQSDPGLTATWYLDFRAAVEDIYDLGTKRASLEHACFNPETITIITDKLPFSDSYLLHDHLKEIMNMIKNRKANAQKQANNKYKSDIKSSTLNALHTHVALAKPSLPDTPTTPRFEELHSRFESWTEICSGTESTYPSYYDMQNLASYTRQPKKCKVNPSGTTNIEYRICKIMDTTGVY